MSGALFKITVIFFLPALIPATDLLIAWSRWRDFLACAPGTTPSVLTFSYSELRPGSTPSCLSSGWYSGLDSEKLEPETKTTPAMLLYWNGIKEKRGPFLGQRVLIGQSYPASVYALDLDRNKVLWRHEFIPVAKFDSHTMPVHSSTPVIDRRTLRVYGSFIEARHVGKKANGSRLTQHYYSIGLDGSGLEHREIDLSKILLEKGFAATPEFISKYFRCINALDLNAPGSPQYLYSGCSLAHASSIQEAQFVQQDSKQDIKGVRGVLLKLPLDPTTGRFSSAAIPAFAPPQLGLEPETGMGGGIWHAGNLYPFSSSAATIERDGRLFTVINETDGWLKAFDPLHVPGTSTESGSEIKIVDGFIFGQPVVFPGIRNAALVSTGGNGRDGLHWVGYKLTDRYELRKRWEINSPFHRVFNSSAAGTYSSDGDSPLLLIPLIAGGPERTSRSSLQLIDAENGFLLDELHFEGDTLFSMPTVIDDRAYLATIENGIQVFKAHRRFRDFLRFHAWVGRFVWRFVWF